MYHGDMKSAAELAAAAGADEIKSSNNACIGTIDTMELAFDALEGIIKKLRSTRMTIVNECTAIANAFHDVDKAISGEAGIKFRREVRETMQAFRELKEILEDPKIRKIFKTAVIAYDKEGAD